MTFFFFKQKTAYEMRISDWSSDVCSSDLTHALSQPAFESALEVLAANGVETLIAPRGEYTPTPVISHAILVYNRGRTSGLADGKIGSASCRERVCQYV